MKRRSSSRPIAPTPSGATNAITEILAGFNPKDPSTISLVEASVEQSMKLAFLQMNRVQEAFVRIKNPQGRMPRTRIFEAGNQSGKTVIGVAEDLAHAMGFRPWLKKTDPDYRIRIKVPNSGLVGCEVAGQNLIQRLEPLFNEFIPAHCEPEPTRYSDGSLKSIYLKYDYNGNKCGSTIHFRSYVQSADSFEGVLSDWLHWDEPPPQAILNAALRGGMATNAPRWLTMTPLKEPYIYDLFSLHAFNNNGDDPEIAIFRCATWENCQDWCRDCNTTIERNKPERFPAGGIRPVDYCPTCHKVMGFMPRAGIENYLKTITDEDEREAREEGKWKHLSGAIYKTLSRETHLYNDFTIPHDWMRIEIVDPHDAKPTRWLFGAVSPEDIIINGRPANRIYFYTYLLADGNIDTIARAVKVKRAEHDYREPAMVIIDAKFGTKTVKTADDETSWEDELDKAGIKRIVLSHSAPGDIAIGHKIVKQYLQPHYSRVQNREFPGILFAREGCSGNRGPIQDMFNYRWQEGKDKPELDFKDMADCVRYAAMEQPLYKSPQLEGYIPPSGPVEHYNPLYHGLVMR
jgi:phage terminase large subunit-like protein